MNEQVVIVTSAGVARLQDEVARIAEIKARGCVPVECGPAIPVAPGRGPMMRFTPREMRQTEGGGFVSVKTGEAGRDAARVYGAIEHGMEQGELVLVSGVVDAAQPIRIKQNDNFSYPTKFEGTGQFEFLVKATNGVGMRLYTDVGGNSYAEATITGLLVRKVTMPDELTFVMKGTKSYADEGLNPQVRMMLWQADSSNRIRLQLNTVDARTGQFIAFTQEGGVANSALSASDAYSPGVEVPFSVAAVLTATEIEGFYNGVSTGSQAHGGLPNLMAAPIELFPNGTGTIEQFAIYVGNPGSAALLEATS
ncbi:MAG: hypothetical protein BM560_01060 [Roseobacter sp. MedPE-SWde]|nr:MAG: hypothetical protein BM560_01060 [Roseobacter sp. MedPE-SWde]